MSLDEAGAQSLQNHRRGFVEAFARVVHRAAEGGELTPRQTAAEPEL
jgi:hypothetical protein